MRGCYFLEFFATQYFSSLLNRAIQIASGDIIIFLDGDIIFKNDFILMHKSHSIPGKFIVGGSHININESHHKNADIESAIDSGKIFTEEYFKKNQCGKPQRFRLNSAKLFTPILDWITNRNVLIGCSSSVWKKDLLRVAGLDESIGYGGEDINLGIRLNNSGIKGLRKKYSIPHLHLEHGRPYRNEDLIAANKKHNAQVKKSKVTQPLLSVLLP